MVFNNYSAEVAIQVVRDALSIHHEMIVVIFELLRGSSHAEINLGQAPFSLNHSLEVRVLKDTMQG